MIISRCILDMYHVRCLLSNAFVSGVESSGSSTMLRRKT